MRISKKTGENLIEAVKVFFISTTLICILCGTLGSVFFSEERIEMAGYFSPPIFGAISAVLSFLFGYDKEKVTSTAGILARQILLLLLIEASVFGLNYLAGNIFGWKISVIVFLGVAGIFVLVSLLSYLYDRRKAEEFNRLLKDFNELQ